MKRINSATRFDFSCTYNVHTPDTVINISRNLDPRDSYVTYVANRRTISRISYIRFYIINAVNGRIILRGRIQFGLMGNFTNLSLKGDTFKSVLLLLKRL